MRPLTVRLGDTRVKLPAKGENICIECCVVWRQTHRLHPDLSVAVDDQRPTFVESAIHEITETWRCWLASSQVKSTCRHPGVDGDLEAGQVRSRCHALGSVIASLASRSTDEEVSPHLYSVSSPNLSGSAHWRLGARARETDRVHVKLTGCT